MPRKLTYSALSCALAIVMLAAGSLLPTAKLALSAVAGIFVAACAIMCGRGYAALAYAAAERRMASAAETSEGAACATSAPRCSAPTACADA